MTTRRQSWTELKNDIALRLHKGECGGSYSESVLILCSVISALSADVWPGRSIDKVRFVELLKMFSPAEMNVDKVSIPLLVAELDNKSKTTEKNIIKNNFLNVQDSLIVTGNDVDKYEYEILMKCSNLSLKEIREQCYASILYSEVRSGYTHEYMPGERADSWPMTGKKSSISYINWADKPNRTIHFHVEWVSKLALSLAKAVDKIDNQIPLKHPEKWWLNG